MIFNNNVPFFSRCPHTAPKQINNLQRPYSFWGLGNTLERSER